MLFFPAGAPGPAFLLSENFFVLKAYNFSDSYAFAARSWRTGSPGVRLCARNGRLRRNR